MLPGLVSLLVWDLDGLAQVAQVEGVRRFLQPRSLRRRTVQTPGSWLGGERSRRRRSPGWRGIRAVAIFVAAVIAGEVVTKLLLAPMLGGLAVAGIPEES